MLFPIDLAGQRDLSAIHARTRRRSEDSRGTIRGWRKLLVYGYPSQTVTPSILTYSHPHRLAL